MLTRMHVVSATLTRCRQSYVNCMVCYCEEMSEKKNPNVFLDLSIDENPAERIVIELFADVVPKTAENFRALCTGERGMGPNTGKQLHYKGSELYRFRKGLCIEGGDFENQDGSGGESVYGVYFDDENFELDHSEPGLLTMSNVGENTNGSKFFIIFRPARFLNGFHVVFGKVIKGMETVEKIEQLGSHGRKPSKLIKITDCGEIFEDKMSNLMESDKGEKEKNGKSGDGPVKRAHESIVGDKRKKQKKNLTSEPSRFERSSESESGSNSSE